MTDLVAPTLRVELTWGHSDDESLLRASVAAGLNGDVDTATLLESRICPACAATDHGRPLVRHLGRSAGHVSLSRHHDIAVVAWSPTVPVGVDVDSASASTWVHREARGKAVGTGVIGVDPHWLMTCDLVAPAGMSAALCLDTDIDPERWDVRVRRAAPAHRATT